MPINPGLLVSAPMLQDYFVDKITGKPLAGGLVRLYQDTQRNIFKNWYYQAGTGTPGEYSYIALDNPMYLSDVGTIQDPNGNDVIPFFYPFDENDQSISQPYFITVYATDINGRPTTLQFTRENFPFQTIITPPDAAVTTLRNYILNNVYWRNIGSANVTGTTGQPFSLVIAPSQHEGYTNGDIQFVKNVGGSTDTLSFIPMTETLENDITPETQINFQCTEFVTGENLKCVQYPLSLHVDTLQNQAGSIVVHAQNVAGGANNQITVAIYQFLGTGAIAQPAPIIIQTLTLNDTYQKFIIPVILPSAATVTVGPGGDDALFIQIGYPTSAVCNINHTKPQFYLSSNVPSNDFDTYDQIETIINSPRVGDVKISLNKFQPFGFVPMNDGTIGDAASNSTTRANIDTWPLFNLIWGYFSTSQSLAPMFTSASSSTAYGSTAIADFMANNQISLTKQAGRLIAGVGTPSSGLNTGTAWTVGQTTGNELHMQIATEVGPHIHASPSVGSPGQFLIDGPGGLQIIGTGSGATTSGATGNVDRGGLSQTAMNVQNPGSYQNIYMKL